VAISAVSSAAGLDPSLRSQSVQAKAGASGAKPAGGPPPGGGAPSVGGGSKASGTSGTSSTSTNNSSTYDVRDTNQDGVVSSAEALAYSLKQARAAAEKQAALQGYTAQGKAAAGQTGAGQSSTFSVMA
jgi:hypothetical protein